MNTGVQRVVRELFRCLAARASVTPVVWDPALADYCRLSRRERGFLESPFLRGAGGDAEPGRLANPVPFFSKFARSLAHRRNRLLLAPALTPADALFVPEIFQDNRLDWLAERAKTQSARLIGVCHDAIAWRRPDITPPARQAGFAAYLAALGNFSHIVCVSQETAGDLATFWRETGHPSAPVTVLGWPVNHAGAARDARPLPNHARPSVLCVGTFEPRKNHLVLLEAARLLWERGLDFELVLIGRTTAQWGGRVLTAIEALQAAGRPVRWLRHVDDITLAGAYQDCAFTVFPSLVEGFGLPILESVWHGRPCVCGGAGAIGEAAAGGGCLLVDQGAAASLASGIERLLTEPGLAQSLYGQAIARSFETWETLAERLLPALNP